MTPPPPVVGVARMGVAIIDDDHVTIGFTRTEHVVDEDGTAEVRTLNMCVQMTGEIERQVSVSATSTPGTASGKDFILPRQGLFIRARLF